MHLRAFLKAGHTPSLVCAFLYFDISFMVWVLLGALANALVPEFGLSDAQKGLLVAVPLLGGAFLRLVLGLLTDHCGTALATFFGPRLAESYGWHAVFGLALLPVLLTLLTFLLFAKDSPEQPAPRPPADYLAVLRQR